MTIETLLPQFRDILDAICRGRDIKEVLQMVLDRACQLAEARHGSLIQIDWEKEALLIVCTSGQGWTADKKKVLLKIGEGVTGTVAKTGEPYLCTNTEKDPKCIVLFPSMKSEVAVPVVIHGKVWAVINMDSESYDAFDEKTLKTLTAFAETVSFAIATHVTPR